MFAIYNMQFSKMQKLSNIENLKWLNNSKSLCNTYCLLSQNVKISKMFLQNFIYLAILKIGDFLALKILIF